jgi:putative addiction module killer protein
MPPVPEPSKNGLRRTRRLSAWLNALDQTTRDRIETRLHAAEEGQFGDIRSVGDGVFEMRFHFGPGYRIYYYRAGATLYRLLCGGDKDTQDADARLAIRMKNAMEGGHGHGL